MMVTGYTQSKIDHDFTYDLVIPQDLDLFTYDLVMPPGLQNAKININFKKNKIAKRIKKIKSILLND